MDSCKWNHFDIRSWLMIGWNLQCLKQDNEDQNWRADLSGVQTSTKDLSIENLWEQKMESTFSGIRWDPISSKLLRVCPSGDFSIYPSKAKKHWDGQVDRQVLEFLRDAWMDMLPVSAMTKERRENQYLADVTHENDDRQEEMMKSWTLVNKRPGTTGTLHRWPPTKGYFH